MKEVQILIRDCRQKTMFKVDDEYLNGYARLCGTNATLVYLCLCRHSDRQQESFPSIETMAQKLGVSRDSVMRGIKDLIKWNIISKSRKRRRNKTWLCNTYTLLDKSVWKPKPSSKEQHGELSRKNGESQVANNASSQVAESDTKDTHSKDTHKNVNAEASSAGMSFANLFLRKGRDDDTPMELQEFADVCCRSTERHASLIGKYAEHRKLGYSTRGQWRQFVRRNIRPAQRLAQFTNEQIKKAVKRIERAREEDRNFLEKWGMETIEKYLEG